MKELHEDGFLLLRGAIPQERVAAYRQAVESIYAGTDGNGDITWPAFNAKSGLDFRALFANRDLKAIAKSVGTSAFYNGTMLSVGKGRNTIAGIGLHTDGIIQGSAETVLCFWTPLHPCGVEAPGLAVVRAGREQVLSHLRLHFADKKIPGWYSTTEWNDTAAFRIETIREAFGEPFTPEMFPGDVMVFTNWTIHGSHVTPGMDKPRSAAVLRQVSLWEKLKARLGRYL